MAPTHLLDTSVYCQPIRKRPVPSVVERWRALGDDALVISVLCEAEVRQGLEAKGSPELWQRYAALLEDRLEILPLDLPVAQVYATLAGRCSRAGRPRPVMDLLIAATARRAGLVLATLNPRDLSGVDGVAVEDWSA